MNEADILIAREWPQCPESVAGTIYGIANDQSDAPVFAGLGLLMRL